MRTGYAALKAGSEAVQAAMSAARSARNRATREAAADARDAGASARRYKRARAREDRERERAMKRRFRVQVSDTDRPRMKGRTRRNLYYRLAAQAMGTRITNTGATGSSGTRSIHFAVTARGFASRTGRAWRHGEGERAALYIVREEALEGGEAGWWSNIAADRIELAAFHRASEALERHDRANANVYMSEVIALPAGATPRQRRTMVKRYCEAFDRDGIGYTVAMHLPDPNGDGRNYHCHIIYSLRPVTRLGAYDWSFAASKVADMNTPDGIRARRGLAVAAINATLTAAGSTQHYTDASNRARGLGAPSPKQGQAQTWALRRAGAMEASLATLAQWQTAAADLREGLALLQRVEAARIAVLSRLRGVLDGAGTAMTDDAHRVGAVRTRVRDGLVRERKAASAADTDVAVATAKTRVVGALTDVFATFAGPDAAAARIAAAAANIARRDAHRRARRKALEEALGDLAALPPTDLRPSRTAVAEQLLVSHGHISRPLPDLSGWQTRVRSQLETEVARIAEERAADRRQIIALAPAKRPDGGRRADPVTPGGASLPASANPAADPPAAKPPPARSVSHRVRLLREEVAERVHSASIPQPALPDALAGDDAARLAEIQDDEALRKRLAAARAFARIVAIRERAFARLSEPGVRIRLDEDGGYRIPSRLLNEGERAALLHADYRANTRARLAALYAAQDEDAMRGAPSASGHAPPPVPPETKLEAEQERVAAASVDDGETAIETVHDSHRKGTGR